MKNVFIVRNDHEDSKRCERLLREKFNSLGVGVNSGYTEDTKLIICIGAIGVSWIFESLGSIIAPPKE